MSKCNPRFPDVVIVLPNKLGYQGLAGHFRMSLQTLHYQILPTFGQSLLTVL
jgi:hypothetical protein